MFTVHWFAVEGDPSGYFEYTANAALLVATIACLSFMSWRIILNIRRTGAGLTLRPSHGAALLGLVVFALAALWVSPPLLLIRLLAVLAILSTFGFAWLRSCVALRTPFRDAVTITFQGGCLSAAVLFAIAFPAMESRVTGSGLTATEALVAIDMAQISNVDGYLPVDELLARQDVAERLRNSKWVVSGIPTRAGRDVNLSDEYLVSLTPRAYMRSAQFTIIMDHCGPAGAYYKDTRGLPVLDFPLAPEAQGWRPLWPKR